MTEDVRTTIDMDSLVGQEFDLYGVDGNCFKLDDVVYEAVEDQNDGYRSMLEDVRVVPESEQGSLVFFRSPLDRVHIKRCDSRSDSYHGYDVWDVVGSDGYVWLSMGTIDVDDYYPSFVFEWNPKEPSGGA